MRQGKLGMERRLVTKTWWKRVFNTVVGMVEVDALRAFRSLTQQESTHKQFLQQLTKEIFIVWKDEKMATRIPRNFMKYK